MELKEVRIEALKGTLEPELYVQANFHIRSISIIPINVCGYIFLKGVKIGNLVELEYGKGIEEKLVSLEQGRSIDVTVSRLFFSSLSRIAIDAINNSRASNPKGDVHLEIKFSFKCIESNFKEKSIEKTVNSISLLPSLVDGTLLRYRVYPFHHEYKISASDWLHDFYPQFALERFMVLELPLIETGLNVKKDNLSKRLHEALRSFDEMRSAFEKSDWNLVIKESRPIWELQKKQEEINMLLRNDDLSEPAILSFNSLLFSLFDFASKFIHKEDKSKQVMPYSKASKEDAVLVYTLAAAILNLLSQKRKRIEA